MSRQPCPLNYVEYSNACFSFGSHLSYNLAEAECEKVGARLVDINQRFGKYVKEKVQQLGGNAHWIGTYVDKGKKQKRKGDICPTLKGQNSGGSSFANVNCNSAYPYICQKYGKQDDDTPSDQFPEGPNVFGRPPQGEVELQITERPKIEETTAVPESSSANNDVTLAVVLPIVALLVIVIVLRYWCKRRERKSRMKKMKELKAAEIVKASNANSIVSGVSTLNKPFSLPVTTSINTTASRPNREASANGVRQSRKSTLKDAFDDWKYQERGRTQSFSKADVVPAEVETQRSEYSSQMHLHGIQRTPPPSYRNLNPQSRHQSRGRSRRGSIPDRETSRLSESSRSPSPESGYSDSGLSRVTREVHQHRRHRSNSRHRCRSSYTPHEDHYNRRSDHYRSGRYRHRRSGRSRRSQFDEPRSMYERYAAKKPPSPAMNGRREPASEFLDRQSNFRRSLKLRGGDPRYDADLTQGRLPVASGPIYFPEMTRAFSRDELQPELSAASFRKQSRVLRQGPIRVNRHIHDYDNQDFKQRTTSEESEHIYESLDEVKRPGENAGVNFKSQPITLHNKPLHFPDKEEFVRDVNRLSGRSRVSMRSRDLSRVPIT
ncbi:unnamed protein product [Clavelina lepadiformis]|uniref:C-type lectin domain-containing protein n=1 Tax=Clavelina lepadiformis TaxID=159417 RepID=A0ABP0GTM3_CLALP